MGDRTGGAYPGVFEAAVGKLNMLKPEFVVSVGDLIEGYTDNNKEQLDVEWTEFESLVDKLKMPFFYTVGNHDISDNTSLDIWNERLGRTYYHFIYKNVLTDETATIELNEQQRLTSDELVKFFQSINP